MICTSENAVYEEKALCNIRTEADESLDSFDVITAGSNANRLNKDHTMRTSEYRNIPYKSLSYFKY